MSADEQWMQGALTLAGKGVGLASPNPTVGCVLVDAEGQLVGEGFHQYEQRDHAEIVALRAAHEKSPEAARGTTAYVTLEPCSHTGRTGPCADALIAAGVARVVVATLDANPLVCGHGVARLRAAGIAVDVGVLATPAQRINDAFAKFIRTGRPWVTLKAALSLDGRIAPPAIARSEQAPFWLTGEAARDEVHRLRHAHDAVLTGIGTVLADDPLLTDRSQRARRRPLQRVVLDTHLRTPPEAKLVATLGDVVVFTCSENRQKTAALEARGVRVERLNPLHLEDVFARLAALGITSVMVEAGTGINTAVLQAGLADRLVLFYAPRLLGSDGVPFVNSALELSLQPKIETFADDIYLTSTLQTYWGDYQNQQFTAALC